MRDYSVRVEADISYCNDVSVVVFGYGREEALRGLGKGSRISKHDVREYYISKDLRLPDNSVEEAGVPHFQLSSSELETELPTSSILPASASSAIIFSDLYQFQLQWCLESSINNNVLHNFCQGLYATTYISSRFAIPKTRVIEVVGMGLTEASEIFTLPQWETAFSFSLEIIRYKNARCAFLVSSIPFVSFPFLLSKWGCDFVPPFRSAHV